MGETTKCVIHGRKTSLPRPLEADFAGMGVLNQDLSLTPASGTASDCLHLHEAGPAYAGPASCRCKQSDAVPEAGVRLRSWFKTPIPAKSASKGRGREVFLPCMTHFVVSPKEFIQYLVFRQTLRTKYAMLYATTGGAGRLQPPSGRLPRRPGPPPPERRPGPWGSGQ